MSTPSTVPVWKADGTAAPGKDRRSLLLIVLLGLVGTLGAFVGVLYWLSPPIEPTALPIVITLEPSGETVPWLEEDRLALAEGGWLGQPRDDWAANPNRDRIRLRFRALANVDRERAVVAYLASPAAVDAAGGVYLLPADKLGDHPRNHLSLSELLTAFRECPSQNRLLILNLVPVDENPLFAANRGDLSTAIFRTLEECPDPLRSCILACSPAEVPFAAPELARTAFGWYLEAGLRGEADGWAGEAADGRVSVLELAAFLRERTSRLASATRGVQQSPLLVGSAADFTLRALTRSQPDGERMELDFSYPDWLRLGWEQRELWQRDGRSSTSPWAYRKLQNALLSAEREFLAGKPAANVQRDLDRELLAVNRLAAALASATMPDPVPTLAALERGYANLDLALLHDLKDAARRFDSRPPAAPAAPGEKPAPEPLVPTEFDPFKAKPHAALALAAFSLLADDPAPSAARIRAIANLLASQVQSPQFAEEAMIQRLAGLAALAPTFPWSAELAALALQTARSLEASSDPITFAWASPAIDRTYRLRANAEAVFFAPGYASTAEAGKRLNEAATAARRLKEAADRLRTAQATWYEAVDWLTGSTAAVYSGTISFPVAEQLAELTARLGDSLALPQAQLDLDAFAERANDWDGLGNAVRGAIRELSHPFQKEALNELRSRAESPESGPAVVAELDAILSIPLLAAADRAKLWNARVALARRLADDALRSDALDRESIRKGLANPPRLDPREAKAEGRVDPEAIRKRIVWSTALLRVGGRPESQLGLLKAELERVASDRFAIAERLHRVWLEDAPGELATETVDRAARLACVLPVGPATARLDSPAGNPASIAHRGAARAIWGWQAARFEYESRELAGQGAALSFALSAARACRAATSPMAEVYLEVSPKEEPKLTPEHPAAQLRMKLRAIGGEAIEEVRTRALSPSSDWLKIGLPASVALDPLRQGTVELALAAGGSPANHPNALGLLVEAEAGGRTYHQRVKVTLEEITDRLELFVRTGAGQLPMTGREIRIRPNGVVQPYQFLLANPTSRERKAIVRIPGLSRETEAISVPSGKTALLEFRGPPVVPVPLPPPGQPPLVDEGQSIDGGEVVLQIFDPADRDVVRQTIRVPVAVANPTDYLRVIDPLFKPAAGSRSNRLSATIVPGDIPAGGPCIVRLGFRAEREQVLTVRDGNLTGPVLRGGPPLSLYADNLGLPRLSGTDAWVTVSADGVERVATYRALLSSVGETVRLKPVGEPMVRVKVEPVATGTEPLPVTLEVDNAPSDATLEFLVGTAANDEAPIAADLTMPIPTAKDVVARVKFDPKGETLLLSGSIKDHAPKLPIELLVGRRVLEARLLDRGGNRLAANRAKVTFDGTPPQNVHFTDLPAKARKDQPLQVRATCDPTISGIKDVKFFVGQPQKNALPQNPPPIAGKLFDEKSNEWRASIPIEGQKGIATIGVQFTTNAGLHAIEVQEVELVDAAELNKPMPGSIAGKLIENRLPQPGATVFLYDDKGNAKAKTATKEDGSFEFKDLPPASYYLFSEKESTNRHIKKEVVVKAGETLEVTLELLLK